MSERLLRLWEEIARCNRPNGAGLHNAPTGLTQSEVLSIRVFDQTVENRVVQLRPPLRITRLDSGQMRMVRFNPIVSYRSMRSAVLGSDFELVVCPIGQTATG